MPELDHCTITVSDYAASRRFYELAFKATGWAGEIYADDTGCVWEDFGFYTACAGRPVTRGLHVGFVAASREHVDAFWQALTEAGYRDDGAPGPRPQYTSAYYGAFVLDPDGNSAEAVHHEYVRNELGVIDHLWLRTCEVAAAREFYETIAPVTGLVLRSDHADRVGWRHDTGSFSFVAGDEPTENVHLAFAVPDNAAVDEFHRLALAAGYRDNGEPGERPQYHPGYYGAFVLDPDGHNVEAVCHNR